MTKTSFAGSGVIGPGDVCVISGGAGGLGLIFAEYLGREYGAKVVLVGRRELEGEKEMALRELRAKGVEVRYVRGDVRRAEEAQGVMRQCEEIYGRVDGVVHAAGELRDGLIGGKGEEEFRAVIEVKVKGVENLDRASAGKGLKWFVMFSSTAGLLGNVGQADYAYGNAYLDSYARERERLRQSGERSGRSLSITWPLWAQGGMKARAGENRGEKLGLGLLDGENGLKIFEAALRSGEGQVFGGVGQGRKLRGWLEGQRAGGSKGTEGSRAESGGGAGPGTRAADQDLEARLIAYLIDKFAKVTKLPASEIRPDEPVENYGLDSILVTGIAQELENDLGDLSKTLLFEFPTLAALADYLLENRREKLEAIRGSERRLADAGLNLELQDGADGEGAGWGPGPEPDPSGGRADELLERDGIAVIGVFGRYPMAEDLDEFWSNLASGRDCIEEIPADRWDYREHYDPEPGKPGKTSNKWGGFIKGVDMFDPLFFNISPREAQFMDPQERIFLEAVWKTIEDAGYSKRSLSEKAVGVFVGVMYGQYQLFGVEERVAGRAMALSSSYATIANRVSYHFNWHGPSLALDTMCSSSLAAVHLACESLKRGECELAVAGGVNTNLHPDKDIVLSQSRFLASDGRCRPFGDGGDGYVPGEGVGAVLLKPSARAMADGDQIYGIIRGSALNHGGKTNGYTVPNSKSQADVVAAALARAGVDPRTITYIEAHGTGTALGDPIEIAALQQAFSRALAAAAHDPDAGSGAPAVGGQWCAVGSVKSNVGHCESAAGIAGLTKVLLQLKHGRLAPSLHAERLNPRINFAGTFFRVPTSLEDWPAPGLGSLPRRAGISSFGAGGTNAHLIIEEYRSHPAQGEFTGARPRLFVFSARNRERLVELVERHIDFLGRIAPANETIFLDRMAHTLLAGREPFEERLALVASSVGELRQKLGQFCRGESVAALYCQNLKRVSPLPAGDLPAAAGSTGLDEGTLAALARAWVSGAEISWSQVFKGPVPVRISLPTYPFARRRCWVPRPEELEETGASAAGGFRGPLRSSGAGNGEAHSERATAPTTPLTENSPAVSGAMEFSLMFFSDNSQVDPRNRYRLVLEAAKFADAHGFAAVWTPERHFHSFGGVYSSPATLMAGLATVTRRVRLRAGSVVLPLADPIRIVEAWSVVDNLSGGRVDIAFASGWSPNDFVLAPDQYARLREVWLERIPEVRKLWRGEPFERLNGKGDRVRLEVYPRPCQEELAVWLTVTRRLESFIDAGRLGCHVLTMLQGNTLEQLAEKIRRYREARIEAGWDPGAGKVTLMLHTFVHPDREHARGLVRKPFTEYIRSSLEAHRTAFEEPNRLKPEDLERMAEFSYERYCREASLIGDPEGCAEMIRRCRNAGIDEIACLLDFGADAESVLGALPHLERLRRMVGSQPAPARREARKPAVDRVPVTAAVTGSGDGGRAGNGDSTIEPSSCFLEPVWKETPLVAGVARDFQRVLLLHAGAERFCDHLARSMENTQVAQVALGQTTRLVGRRAWEVDQRDPDALRFCLERLDPAELIYFVAGPTGNGASESDLAECAQARGALPFVRLLRALDQSGWAKAGLALKVLTFGSFEVLPGERLDPYQSALFGMAGSLAKEYPDWEITALDLELGLSDAGNDEEANAALWQAIRREPGHRSSDKIALRGGSRYQLRLCPARQETAGDSKLKTGGVYLIIGGAGRVGRRLSEYLAARYGARLMWVGRGAETDEIRRHRRLIEERGGQALYFQATAEDAGLLRAAAQRTRQEWGRLDGVFHSALVYQDELLRRLDEGECARILNSKIKTSAALADAFGEVPLDFIVFLGSAQSFFNEPRRAAYAGGCCFLDAYARHIRRRLGSSVQVLNWGYWNHSFDEQARATLRSAGLGVIEPAEGMQALERLLSGPRAQLVNLKATREALERMGVDGLVTAPVLRPLPLPRGKTSAIAARLFRD